MNILTDEEISQVYEAMTSDVVGSCRLIARAIEVAVLSKLAEQDVEPVGYIYRYQGQEICFSTEPQDTSIQESYYWQKRVFTETQLLAAQLRTAEACAKYVVSGMHDDDPFIIASGIRNGELRKYL